MNELRGDIIISKNYDKKNKNIKYKGQYRKTGLLIVLF